MSVSASWDSENGVRTGVCVVTLEAPERLNALTEALGEDFMQIMQSISQDPELKAVILCGAGRAFSAGGDLDFLDARTRDAPTANSARMRAFYRRFLSVRSVPVPVVAAVHGPAIGAGLCLALACDLRVVATDAKLGATFVGLGLHPGMAGTYTLPRIAGREVAHHLLLTGTTISGAEAVTRGLALCHEPSERVLPRALEIASQIALQSPLAVRATLATLRAADDEGLERALEREANAQAQSYATADLKEGIAALREKRAPRFPGA